MDKSRMQHHFQFLTRDIWKVSPEEVSPLRWKFYRIAMIVQLTIQRFINDRIAVRASALTYSTLLSIIPILAILFGIARGFGVDQLIEEQLRSDLSHEQAELVFTWVNSYLNHVQSGIFVGVGLIMLFWTLVMLIDNIEQSFNLIWQVEKSRSVYRKITDYFSMILLLPLVIVVSSGLTIFMTTYLKNLEEFKLLAPFMRMLVSAIPYTFTCLMFLGLYLFMPNTNVKLKHAWVPALLAGLAFQTFQFFYINSQIWISNYNAIYGSFAAIPFFLLWAQISWNICLFGAEMSFASQNLASYNFTNEADHISRYYYNLFCTIILADICKRLQENQPPTTAQLLSQQHHIPIKLTQKILYHLVQMKLVVETATGQRHRKDMGYIPRVDIHQLTLGMLLDRLEKDGSNDFPTKTEHYPTYTEALEKAQIATQDATRDLLLINL